MLQLMTMDYGDSAAPNPEGRMGTYAIEAATNAYAQARSVGLTNTKIGIIPMIGVNDVMSEVRGKWPACSLAACMWGCCSRLHAMLCLWGTL